MDDKDKNNFKDKNDFFADNVFEKEVQEEKKYNKLDLKRIGLLAIMILGILVFCYGIYWIKKDKPVPTEENQDIVNKPVDNNDNTDIVFNPLDDNEQGSKNSAEVEELLQRVNQLEEQLRSNQEKSINDELSSPMIISEGNTTQTSVNNFNNKEDDPVARIEKILKGNVSNDDNANTQGGRFTPGDFIAPSSKANYKADRRFLIQQGKIIDAVLSTAIKSDIPGNIIAKITDDVYGEEGRYILLPKGTRLFGEYSSMINIGQKEVAMVWRRAITPQGIEIMLDSPSSNGLGIMGTGGKVNNHYLKIFAFAGALSILSAGTSLAGVDKTDRDNSISHYRDRLSNDLQSAASNILSSRMNIRPTITIKHGTRIKVLIAKDLDFSNLTD